MLIFSGHIINHVFYDLIIHIIHMNISYWVYTFDVVIYLVLQVKYFMKYTCLLSDIGNHWLIYKIYHYLHSKKCNTCFTYVLKNVCKTYVLRMEYTCFSQHAFNACTKTGVKHLFRNGRNTSRTSNVCFKNACKTSVLHVFYMRFHYIFLCYAAFFSQIKTHLTSIKHLTSREFDVKLVRLFFSQFILINIVNRRTVWNNTNS